MAPGLIAVRRLSCAVVADDPQNLAPGHIECHVPYRPEQIIAELRFTAANGIEIYIAEIVKGTILFKVA